MAAKVKHHTENTAAVVAAVFFLNWLSAQYLNYPFVWCFGKWAVQPFLQPWLFVVHFLALGYFCLCVMKRDAFKAIIGLMVVVLVYGLPTFLEILFRLGKSCS
jgi:hypothetical protein